MGAEGKSGEPVGLANAAEAIRGGEGGYHRWSPPASPPTRRLLLISIMPRFPLRNNIHIGSDRVKPVDFNLGLLRVDVLSFTYTFQSRVR
jgi:hypothetical protein